MTDALNAKPALGTAIHAVTGKWGRFVALGVGELILGGVASVNLVAATLASALVIGAAVFVVLQDYISSMTVNWMSFIGLIFVLVVLFFPRGILGLVERKTA